MVYGTHSLSKQGEDLLAFFGRRTIDKTGGFYEQMTDGGVYNDGRPKQIHNTTRMAHSHAIGVLLGNRDSEDILDHAMDTIWTQHRDRNHGGYFWSVRGNEPVVADKLAYGHAFVLLAASSAKTAGHPDADRLLADITEILNTKFWEPEQGLSAEEFRADWSPFSDYRGQNANMHLVEALMGAFEVTGAGEYLDKARSITERIILENAAAYNWRVPEHFHADWSIDLYHDGNPIFRPYGSTPGHGLEWARLVLQLWVLDGKRDERLVEAAKSLFARAINDGWAPGGGFFYTVNWDGSGKITDRYWWPVCEGIAAAHWLAEIVGDEVYSDWQRRMIAFADAHLIDHHHGGWHPQLNSKLQQVTDPFYGKPDIYHALQAMLIPTLPAQGSLPALLGAGHRRDNQPASIGS